MPNKKGKNTKVAQYRAKRKLHNLSLRKDAQYRAKRKLHNLSLREARKKGRETELQGVLLQKSRRVAEEDAMYRYFQSFRRQRYQSQRYQSISEQRYQSQRYQSISEQRQEHEETVTFYPTEHNGTHRPSWTENNWKKAANVFVAKYKNHYHCIDICNGGIVTKRGEFFRIMWELFTEAHNGF